jgi:hypothetical protein
VGGLEPRREAAGPRGLPGHPGSPGEHGGPVSATMKAKALALFFLALFLFLMPPFPLSLSALGAFRPPRPFTSTSSWPGAWSPSWPTGSFASREPRPPPHRPLPLPGPPLPGGPPGRERGKALVRSPWVYALSLAVYATAWTFFGSVGPGGHPGASFLPVYLGPTLVLLLWPFLHGRLLELARAHRLTSWAELPLPALRPRPPGHPGGRVFGAGPPPLPGPAAQGHRPGLPLPEPGKSPHGGTWPSSPPSSWPSSPSSSAPAAWTPRRGTRAWSWPWPLSPR